MPEAVTALRAEIAARREHGGDYHYAAYLLRPHDGTTHPWTTTTTGTPASGG